MLRLQDTLKTLQTLVRPALAEIAEDMPIPVDVALIDLGMSSAGAIQMVVEVEREFGLEFPDHMLNQDTFRDLTSLAKAVMALKS